MAKLLRLRLWRTSARWAREAPSGRAVRGWSRTGERIACLGHCASGAVPLRYALLLGLVVFLAAVTPLPGDRTVRVILQVAAVAVTVVTIGAVWRRTGPKRRAWAARRPADSMPPSHQVRLYTKRQSLLRALARDSDILLKNRMEVRHLMTRDVVVVPSTARRGEMASLMAEYRVRHLMVCGEDGRLLGIVSNRDLLGGRGELAEQIMTSSPRTVSPDTPISPAITHLINQSISCLPVLEGDCLCGVLTTTDLILTLQCTLQLWLRVAQLVESDTEYAEQVGEIGQEVDRDLAKQRLRLEELRDRILAFGAHYEPDDVVMLLKEAEETLTTTTHVVDHVVRVRNQIREQTRRIVNLMDVRTDSLTGLNSRRALDEMLDMLLAVKSRYGQPFSLVLVAVDQLQEVRDAHGEIVAEGVLKAAAETILSVVREADFVARLAHDAFAVVLPQTELPGARSFCRRLQQALAKDWPPDVPVEISTSLVSARSGEDSPALLARAETALPESDSRPALAHRGDATDPGSDHRPGDYGGEPVEQAASAVG